jgi:hypothetical protein
MVNHKENFYNYLCTNCGKKVEKDMDKLELMRYADEYINRYVAPETSKGKVLGEILTQFF